MKIILNQSGLFFLHLSEALAAVNGTVISGSERNLCYTAAGSTGSLEHFSFTLSAVLACVAAALASLRLVLKALFSVKFLFACREYELFAALFAY